MLPLTFHCLPHCHTNTSDLAGMKGGVHVERLRGVRHWLLQVKCVLLLLDWNSPWKVSVFLVMRLQRVPFLPITLHSSQYSADGPQGWLMLLLLLLINSQHKPLLLLAKVFFFVFRAQTIVCRVITSPSAIDNHRLAQLSVRGKRRGKQERPATDRKYKPQAK